MPEQAIDRKQWAMPVPLAPYPPPPPPVPFPASNGGQSQLVCSGCRNLLLYPLGAATVCCAVCNAVTPVPPPGTEMAQLVCGGCHTLLMYIRGATSVQCSCCHTVNLAHEGNQVAHVNCGNCMMLLMYQYGARSVKCAVCNFVTPIALFSAVVIRAKCDKLWNVGFRLNVERLWDTGDGGRYIVILIKLFVEAVAHSDDPLGSIHERLLLAVNRRSIIDTCDQELSSFLTS